LLLPETTHSGIDSLILSVTTYILLLAETSHAAIYSLILLGLAETAHSSIDSLILLRLFKTAHVLSFMVTHCFKFELLYIHPRLKISKAF
jgi:hypothetical protein